MDKWKFISLHSFWASSKVLFISQDDWSLNLNSVTMVIQRQVFYTSLVDFFHFQGRNSLSLNLLVNWFISKFLGIWNKEKKKNTECNMEYSSCTYALLIRCISQKGWTLIRTGRLDRGGAKRPLPKICYTYPTIVTKLKLT